MSSPSICQTVLVNRPRGGPGSEGADYGLISSHDCIFGLDAANDEIFCALRTKMRTDSDTQCKEVALLIDSP